MSDKPTIRALLEDQSMASYLVGVMHVERHNRDSIIYRLDLQVLRNQPLKGWLGTTCTPADPIENLHKVRVNRWFTVESHRRLRESKEHGRIVSEAADEARHVEIFEGTKKIVYCRPNVLLFSIEVLTMSRHNHQDRHDQR
jgi:hypothetical protein